MSAAAIILGATLAALRVPTAPLSSRIASYEINVVLDEAAHTLTGHEVVHWKNPGAVPVDALVLHMYMNAFGGPETRFARESGASHRGNTASHTEAGKILVTHAFVDGKDLAANLKVDETLARLPLGRSVQPNETIDVTFDFVTTLPRVWARTGFGERFIAAGQWFPKIAEYDCRLAPGCGFRAAQLHANSEFFADFGVYDVTVDVPSAWVVAASGVLVEKTARDARTVHRYHAEDVHDFAWFASPDFTVIEGDAHDPIGPVHVAVYAGRGTQSSAARHLDSAIRGLEMLATWLRPFPYAQLSIVIPPEDSVGAGGMEYPTLITGFHSPSPEWLRLPEMVTLHELAHQYFYGMVASDEPEEAWLDEGLTEYAGSRLLDRLYGGIVTTSWLTMPLLPLHSFALQHVSSRYPIALPSYAYPNGAIYGSATYSKTATALSVYEALVGVTQFDALFRAYVERQSFHHPGRAEFVNAMGNPEYWNRVLDLREPLDYSLAPFACDDEKCIVTVERSGPAFGDVNVRCTLVDGDIDHHRWTLAAQQLRAHEVYRLDDVSSCTVEQGVFAPLDNDPSNDAIRRNRDPRAMTSLASIVGLAASFVLSLVGP